MQQAKPERKLTVFVKVSDLLFDPENYRLPEQARGASQDEILHILEEDFDLTPIGQSIAQNGFFPEEPLVVIPTDNGRFIDVEGNRRLAALKFLTDPSARLHSLDARAWEDLSNQIKYDVSEVPCIQYDSREDLINFLGFRHIAGIVKWDPLSKARFIAALVERNGPTADFRVVAKETGSRTPTIRDNYIAYRIVLQARDNFDIDTSRLEKDFSVFYRSLSTPAITRFIGLVKDKAPVELQLPVPEEKAGALEELIGFIHGTRKVTRVLNDSRQLTRLGEILENEEALRQLRLSRNLELAHALTGGEERRLVDNLHRASFYLDEALRDAHRHTESKVVSESVFRSAQSMEQILRSYPEVKRRLEQGK